MDEDTIKIFLFSIAGFFGGIALFFFGFRWFRQKRLIENTPTSKVRSIAMGFVELFGSAIVFKEVLKSPFTGKDCVYYFYEIQELRSSGKHSRWVTVAKGSEGRQFFLKDDTGKVLVDPANAKVDIPADNEFGSSWGKDPPKQAIEFMRSKHLSFESLFGINKSMRFTEKFIEPGDKLFILGTAGGNPFLKPGVGTKNEEHIMIAKGNNVYYIADKPETEVLKKFKWKSIGGIFGGAALSIVCLIVIFISLNLI